MAKTALNIVLDSLTTAHRDFLLTYLLITKSRSLSS